jgi:hypothetical protein
MECSNILGGERARQIYCSRNMSRREGLRASGVKHDEPGLSFSKSECNIVAVGLELQTRTKMGGSDSRFSRGDPCDNLS